MNIEDYVVTIHELLWDSLPFELKTISLAGWLAILYKIYAQKDMIT